MTRINFGVPVNTLCDQHLIAEYRELPRARALAEKWLAKGRPGPQIPEAPTLGTGHVRYFYDKGAMLRARWLALVQECQIRGIRVQHTEWRGWPESLQHPKSFDASVLNPGSPWMRAITARIAERMPAQPRFSYQKVCP